jgi:hypothetical protein
MEWRYVSEIDRGQALVEFGNRLPLCGDALIRDSFNRHSHALRFTVNVIAAAC